MSTLTMPVRPDSDLDDLNHGVHTECQLQRPTVKSICGVELEWVDGQIQPGVEETCVVCRDLDICPVCGAVVPA